MNPQEKSCGFFYLVTTYFKRREKMEKNSFENRSEQFNGEKEYLKNEEERKNQFPPLSIVELANVLDLTIKEDSINKVTTFLCFLAAYTENSQFNISFNAPSSSGKSYIPLEIASLFPKEDVIKVAYCSPTAFFHDNGEFCEERRGYVINLERKILVFLDQPHTLLLEHLRPLLSHDEKEINIKITDKSQKFGLKTKNIVLKGFSSVINCSASLKMDEQESTRFLLLSPETTQCKIIKGINEALDKEANQEIYYNEVDSDHRRQSLIKRIKAIKEEGVKDIKLHDIEKIRKWFFEKHKILKPRHQRDIKRIIFMAKSITLLNLWHKEKEAENIIVTSGEDIDVALKIWEEISISQELNLPPYVYNLFNELIVPLYQEKGEGLSMKDILVGHAKIYDRPLEEWKLRREIIPMLETAGLVAQEKDPNDKRRTLITPVYFLMSL